MDKTKAHMICHTHWDREWYFTREEFRVKLVRLIDGLLEIIENNDEYVSFMLDGQTIAIEDYLEIKPGNRERLFKALSDGKIVCGPWYILPDELLVSGESHIRNYLIGKEVLGDDAARMKVAYLPDSFGHPEQMPQIIAGLGMEAMVFWRGTANHMEKTEFYWSSPGGFSKILCVHMPSGYGNSGRLINDINKSVPRLKKMISNLAGRSTTDTVLLMNGSDHITGQFDIVDIIKSFNENDSDAKIIFSTLENFITDIKSEIKNLKTFSGEFRYGERSMLLGGTLSTRMPLKLNNHTVQSLMEKYIEPILAYEFLMSNNNSQSEYCAYIWKKILENHPHDSICGCSIDQVHREMNTRFDSLIKLQNLIIKDSVARIEHQLPHDQIAADAQCIIFEPSQDRLNSYIEFEVDMDRILVQEVNFEKSIIEDYENEINHPDIPNNLRITDNDGREIKHYIISSCKTYDTDYQDNTLPEVYKVNRLKIAALLPEFSYGFHLLNIYKTENKEIIHDLKKKSDKIAIENEFYSISFKNAAFVVYDKKSGIIHKSVNKFVDMGDAGDEYTYSWPQVDSTYGLNEENCVVKTDRNDFVECLTVDAVLILPEKLNQDRKSRSDMFIENPVTIKVSLYKGIDRIDFKTEICNNSCDHRLQVEFPSGIRTDKSMSEHCFSMVKRDIDLIVPEEWAEYPQSTHPTHGFTSLCNDEYGVCFNSTGLTEYEAVNGDTQSYLRITLLRSVGWLSRTDLLTRKGNGGWTIETPDAQLIGNHTFEYSITYQKGELFESNSYSLLYKKVYPSVISQLKKSLGDKNIVNVLDFVSDLPKSIRLSALKISKNSDGIILRVYNLTKSKEKINFKLPRMIKKAYKNNLAEERLSELKISGRILYLTLSPSEIMTVEFCM